MEIEKEGKNLKIVIEESETNLDSPLRREVIGNVEEEESIESLEIDERSLGEWPENKGFWRYLIPYHTLQIWMLPIVWKGFRKFLSLSDLPRLNESNKCTHKEETFKRLWKKLEKFRRIRLFLVIYLCFGVEYGVSGLLKLVSVGLEVLYPMLLRQFLLCLQPPLSAAKRREIENYRTMLPADLRPDKSFGEMGFRTNDYMIWVWLIALTVTQFFIYNFQIYSYYMALRVGKKMKVLLTNVIYQKILKLSTRSRQRHTKGEILNHLSYDCYLVDVAHHQAHECWTAPFLVIGASYYLTSILGYPIAFSFVVLLVVLVFIFFYMVILVVLRFKHSRIVDLRVDKMKESFHNILVLKFFNLQDFFLNKILTIRNRELWHLRVMLLFRTLPQGLAYSAPPIMISVGFGVYYFVHRKIDVILLLTSLTYFKMFRVPLVAISFTLLRYANALVSFKRIQSFLDEEQEVKRDTERDLNSEYAVEIEDAIFLWPPTKEKKGGDELEECFSLKNVGLKIKKGSLTMIVGDTRSGKSTFFKSILGETELVEGNLKVNHNVAYCSQECYTENDTILNNILFGKELDSQKLNEVLKICCIDEDIDGFDGGIHLEIGEEGKTLSGGQKSRISLCRAAYHSNECEIYLLDNILSALDLYVSNHVFQYCIMNYLKDKTRMLITNKLEYLPYSDNILYFENGEIVENGKYEVLVARENGKLKDLIGDSVFKRDKDDNEKYQLEKLLRIEKYKSPVAKISSKKKVIQDEERMKGFIRPKTFISYISFVSYFRGRSFCCGLATIICILLFYVLVVCVYLGSELHLSNLATRGMYHETFGNVFNATYYQNYTKDADNNTIYTLPYYYNPTDYGNSCPFFNESSVCGNKNIQIFWKDYRNGTSTRGLSSEYSILVYLFLAVVLFVALPSSFSLCYCTFVTASKRMFDVSLNNIMFSSMSFFYVNPIGRIINRLSHDVLRADWDLIIRTEFIIILFFFTIGVLLLVIVVSYGFFLPVVIVIAVLLITNFLFFRRSTIEIKRLESITRSQVCVSNRLTTQVFHHWSQSLNGILTIKSFGLMEKYIQRNIHRVNVHNRCDLLTGFFFFEKIKRYRFCSKLPQNVHDAFRCSSGLYYKCILCDIRVLDSGRQFLCTVEFGNYECGVIDRDSGKFVLQHSYL